MWAALNGHEDIVSELLKRKADAEAKDKASLSLFVCLLFILVYDIKVSQLVSQLVSQSELVVISFFFFCTGAGARFEGPRAESA